jgi:methylphosphotriester-DNA--protein-cysteine methyltransferase
LGPESALGIGTRQFERVFNANFGLAPKLFQRVARAEGLLRDALRSGRSGAALALEHGYYDQSHMARDLRLFAGGSLRTLAQSVRSFDSEHWALAIGTRGLAPRA